MFISKPSAPVSNQPVLPKYPDNCEHRTQVHRHKLVLWERQRILDISREPENLSPNNVKKCRICCWKWRQLALKKIPATAAFQKTRSE